MSSFSPSFVSSHHQHCCGFYLSRVINQLIRKRNSQQLLSKFLCGLPVVYTIHGNWQFHGKLHSKIDISFFLFFFVSLCGLLVITGQVIKWVIFLSFFFVYFAGYLWYTWNRTHERLVDLMTMGCRIRRKIWKYVLAIAFLWMFLFE
jgi:hypothetical protein